MHVSECLHPIRVYNKYSKEYVWASCGKCSACLSKRSSDWTNRLEQERYCWKYCVFLTLTYDHEHVPLLKCDSTHSYYYDLTHVHHHPDFGDVLIDVHDDVMCYLDEVTDRKKMSDWFNRNDTIMYLSVGDAQRFIKRVRITLDRQLKKYIKQCNEQNIKLKEYEKDAKIRYYLCGEYGETTLRPHYHALFFFNSEFTSSHIGEIIRSCWQFGRTDFSFVASSNASYVAGYVNSLSNLPQVLLHKRIRPFAIYSKQPFIGSLSHSSKEIKEIFFAASPTFTILNHKKGVFDNVPLWMSYQRKLYPKLAGFSKISHTDRVNLYRAFEKFEKVTYEPNFDLFVDWVSAKLVNTYLPTLYRNYRLEHNTPASLLYWYYTSMRVCEQSRSFGIPVRMYVSIIERFYNNVEQLKLKKQYEYEQYLSETGKLDSALALNMEFVKILCECGKSDLTPLTYEYLHSFGIDVEKFYSDNEFERLEYRLSVLPLTCDEQSKYNLDCEIWIKQHTKNKRKNDYLLAHPELGNYLWGDD